jgi:hypothetical protein
MSIIFSSKFLFGHPYKINPVVDQWNLQAPFLAWFLSWKIYSECTTLQRIINVYFTMKNTKNLERISSADRITCFLTYYKHHLFMIIHALSTFTRCWIFTTMYAMENESEKNNIQIVLFKIVTHNISDYFRLT